MGSGAPTPSSATEPDVGERYEAFISYSHLDRSAALTLKDGLRERGLDLWMDESGLHSGQWNAQLEQAIAAADTFLFLISPASAASPECGAELAHALRLGKRILPVPIEPTPLPSLPDRLATYQFVPARGVFGDDVPAALERLVTEITTDRDWVREHTEWSEKAREWERHDHNSSYLLSGAELAAAERWRSSSAGKQPAPSALHNEYIDASREAATKRLRRTRAVFAVALVVAVVLSVVALISRQAAVNAQHQASSGALAAQSVLQLGDDPQLSLLLADRAAHTSQTAAALDALRRAIPANHLIRTLDSADPHPLSAAAFSPDGRRVLTMSQDGRARVFDLATGQILHRFPVPTLSANESSEGASFSADGSEILTWGDGAAHIWSAAGYAPVATIASPTLSFQFAQAVLSPDGRTVATATGPGIGGSDVLWNAHTGARLHTLVGSTSPDAGEDIAFSPDSRLVAVGGNGGTAAVWSVASGALERRFEVTRGTVPASSPLTSVTSVAFSPDSTRLAAGAGALPISVDETEPSQTVILDLATGRQVGPALDGNAPSWSPGGGYVVTTRNDGTANVWATRDGRSVAQMKASYGIAQPAVFGPDVYNPATKVKDIAHVATGSATGKASVWDAQTGAEISELAGDSGTVTPGGFSPDGSRVLTFSSDGEARVWSDGATAPTPAAVAPQVKRAETSLSVVGEGFNQASDPRPPVVAIATGTTAVRGIAPADSLAVLDTRTARPLARMPGDQSFHVAFDPAGRTMLETRTSGSAALPAEIRRVQGGAVLRTLTGATGRATAGIISPDGQLAATVDARDDVAVWEVASGRRLVVFHGHAGRRTQYGPVSVNLSFSPDSRFVASSDERGLTEVWRARTGQVAATIDGPPAPSGQLGHWGARISPDDRYVATFAAWDTEGHVYALGGGRRELLALPAGAGGIEGLAFNPDGSLIATADNNGVELWDTREPSPIQTILGATGVGVAFSPDGLTLELVDADETTSSVACVVCGGFSRLLAEAKGLETRGFTPEERALYLGG